MGAHSRWPDRSLACHPGAVRSTGDAATAPPPLCPAWVDRAELTVEAAVLTVGAAVLRSAAFCRACAGFLRLS
jgi:hypothetical protein